jgi:adenosine deaminase
MLEGLEEAQTKFGIITGLILSGLRNHETNKNILLAKIAKKYQDKGVVGFDLAGDEAGYSAELHQEAFKIIRDSDLGITVHAGEAAGYENVQYAINNINASRIGHGVKSFESKSTMELLKEKKILLEICPTSNIHTGTVESIESHPVKEFFDFGIEISIGDDDPITSRTRVSNELTLIQNTFGFSNNDLLKIQLSSIDQSFLRDDIIKHQLKEKIQEFEHYL